jgi:SAM-dependent methyltransferase
MTDLRTIEADSIRAFVQSAADEGYLSGRVLDFGCGKAPYRRLIEAASGEWFGYDHPALPGFAGDESLGDWDPAEDFDAVLCTQVVQYSPDPPALMRELHWYVQAKPGVLVLSYPTTWPEVEPEDLWRFTKAGMERLLTEAGFEIVKHEQRAVIVGAEGTGSWRILLGEFALGYGVIARA